MRIKRPVEPVRVAESLAATLGIVMRGEPASERRVEGGRGNSRYAVTIFADQLFTNAPRRSSALEKLSPVAAKPKRK